MRAASQRPYGQRELVYVAISRVLAVPMFVGLVLIAGDEISPLLTAIIVGAVFYTGGLLWYAASRHWARIDGRIFIGIDLLVMGAAVAESGGPESQAQVIFYIWTIAYSLLYPPRTVLILVLLAMSVYAAVSLPFVIGPSEGGPDALRALGLVELALLWIGTMALGNAFAFRRRSERIVRLSDARQRLLADALSAEDRARRRLSQSLHDDTLQVLLAVGQDMSTGLHGDTRLLVRAREELRAAIRDLRETIRGLHPAALEHGGLAGGLDAVVERAARYGGFAVDLRVDPAAAGWHDSLIVSLIRELTTNAAKHSEATQLSVTVIRARDAIEIEIADDGKGMTADARDSALAAGHIGLASCAERVDAAGGALELSSAPERGTTVRIALPLPDGSAGSAPPNGDGSRLPRSAAGAAMGAPSDGEVAEAASAAAESASGSASDHP